MKTGDIDREGDWFQTFTGREFYIMDPRESEINIVDIAHALSHMCRYNGHCQLFHSVAAHSILVSRACKPENALWGLLHDASEAYTGDMVSPLKRYMPQFQAVEDKLMSVICSKFGLPQGMPEDVRYADLVVLATEFRDLMVRPPREVEVLKNTRALSESIFILEPHEANKRFLDRFYELTGE